MSLQARLDAFKADFEAGKPPYNVPPSVIATMRRATAELIASGLAERALKVGDRAPALRAQRRQRCGRSFVRVPGARSVGRQLLSGRLVSLLRHGIAGAAGRVAGIPAPWREPDCHLTADRG
jgi:hypothetical protein